MDVEPADGCFDSSGLDSLAGVDFRNRLQSSFEGLQLLRPELQSLGVESWTLLAGRQVRHGQSSLQGGYIGIM